MKISINCGHTKTGAGYGSVYKNKKESEITRLIGNEVIKILKTKGHKVYNSTVDKAATTNDYLKEVVRLANNSNSDLFLSIHCNASSSHAGNGVEVYTYKGNKLIEGIKLCYELSLKGFKNRGVKDGSKLYVIKNTKMKALLVEVFFIDNETDLNIYNKIGYKEIAKAICKAL